MEITTILIGVLCLVAGIALSYFLFSDKKKLAEKENEYEAEKNNLLAEMEKQKQELSAKYDALLNDSTKQQEELKERLQNVINGHVNEEIKSQLEEAIKLKKEVKNLQDDIDDYEDTISSIKKKLSASKEENEALILKIDTYEAENKQLNNNLKDIQEKLSSNIEELNVKITSLDFIHEILTAEEIHNEGDEVAKKHAAIDNIVDTMRGDILSILKEDKSINNNDIEKFFGQSLTKWSIIAKKEWIQNKTTIAFVGEFSAGKTSIVNRILSQDNPYVPLLPVSTKATTAIPTYISGSGNVAFTDFQFVTPNNVQKRIKEETFKKVSKEVLDQIKGVSNLIKYFVMTYNNPNLNNLSILDTPGFSSTDKEDSERTIEVINECDALFWVFDVNSGTVNRSSIQLIKENLHKPLYVVINKVDTKTPKEVKQVEQLINKTLHDAGLIVNGFIRFSSKESLNNIMRPILSVSPDSSQKDFWKELNAFLDNYKEKIHEELNHNKYKLKQTEDAIEKCVEQYVKNLYKLRVNCEDAGEIPQWTEHIFSKDRYEMNEYEHKRLIDLLKDIYSSPQTLSSLFEENGNKQNKYAKISVKIETIKQKLTLLESEVNKIKKDYKIYKS